MKKGINGSLIGMFLIASLLIINASQAEEAKITVLNPLGQPPPLKLLQMAPRLDTLDGKTIYIVDVKFAETKPFFEEMVKLFAERYPRTNWVLKQKIGTYFEDDPELWAEIKKKGDGMIIAVGH
jgi:hypothetical protein